MKAWIILTFFLFITACGSYQDPESYGEKLIRFEGVEIFTNNVPKLELIDSEDFKQVRLPSSFSKKEVFEDYTNKQIYFLTLLSQYNTFRNYLGRDSKQIKYCPQFHSNILTHGLNLAPKQSSNPWINWNSKRWRYALENKHFFPELFLPLGKNKNAKTVYDQKEIDSQIVYQGFTQYAANTFDELWELCEFGTSTNFYIFENLYRHIESVPSFKNSKKAMQALLKTTIFVNMAIIHSLEQTDTPSRSPASLKSNHFSVYEEEVFNRLSAHWSKAYYRNLKVKRSY